MGWLFAVALGLHRRQPARWSWRSLIPIALGHALAVALVALAVVLRSASSSIRALVRLVRASC